MNLRIQQSGYLDILLVGVDVAAVSPLTVVGTQVTSTLPEKCNNLVQSYIFLL